ncbi:hypothetical protein [Phascolarctobacterium sp.]
MGKIHYKWNNNINSVHVFLNSESSLSMIEISVIRYYEDFSLKEKIKLPYSSGCEIVFSQQNIDEKAFSIIVSNDIEINIIAYPR